MAIKKQKHIQMNLSKEIGLLIHQKSQIEEIKKNSANILKYMEEKLQKSIIDIEGYQSFLARKNIRVTIHGSSNSGKSTFVNAFLGKNLVPMAPKSCTARKTEIIYGENECCEIIFQKDAPYEYKNKFKKNYSINEIKELVYIVGEERNKEDFIDKIILKVNSLILKDGLIIVDNPGYEELPKGNKNENLKFNSESKEFYDSDIILFVLTNELLPKELEYLKKFEDKIFFLVNKVDREKDKEEIINDTIYKLDFETKLGKKINNQQIAGISSIKVLENEMKFEYSLFREFQFLFFNFISEIIQKNSLFILKSLLSHQRLLLDICFSKFTNYKNKEILSDLESKKITIKEYFKTAISSFEKDFLSIIKQIQNQEFKDYLKRVVNNHDKDVYKLYENESSIILSQIIHYEVKKKLRDFCENQQLFKKIFEKLINDLKNLKLINERIDEVWNSFIKEIEMNYYFDFQYEFDYSGIIKFLKNIGYYFTFGLAGNIKTKEPFVQSFIESSIDNLNYKKMNDELLKSLNLNLEKNIYDKLEKYETLLSSKQDLELYKIQKNFLVLLELKTSSLYYKIMNGDPKDVQKITQEENVYLAKWGLKDVVLKKIRIRNKNPDQEKKNPEQEEQENETITYIKVENSLESSHFQNELYFTRKIVHKNIINYEGVLFDEENGTILLILEYMNEGNLEKYLIKNPNLNRKELLNICLQIAKGIEKIHSFNLVHSDIKPANILIKKNITGKILIKIGDLGISHTIDEKKEETFFQGTISYSDPAQISRKNYTQESDIYSFGLSVLFVFTQTNSSEALNKLSQTDRVITDLIKKCCSKQDRYRIKQIIEILEKEVDQ